MRVLVAEDDMETRDALVTMLEKAGVEVIAVGTAAEAMAEFERSAPELIVSDIGLPEEDGFQLMQRIRSLELERNLPATPAIALTAFAGPQDRRHARESGYHKHIAKPVTPGALMAAASTFLAEKSRGQAND